MGWDDFDDSVKSELMKEDSEAWYAICAILMTIIMLGLGIAFLAIFFVT